MCGKDRHFSRILYACASETTVFLCFLNKKNGVPILTDGHTHYSKSAKNKAMPWTYIHLTKLKKKLTDILPYEKITSFLPERHGLSYVCAPLAPHGAQPASPGRRSAQRLYRGCSYPLVCSSGSRPYPPPTYTTGYCLSAPVTASLYADGSASGCLSPTRCCPHPWATVRPTAQPPATP